MQKLLSVDYKNVKYFFCGMKSAETAPPEYIISNKFLLEEVYLGKQLKLLFLCTRTEKNLIAASVSAS